MGLRAGLDSEEKRIYWWLVTCVLGPPVGLICKSESVQYCLDCLTFEVRADMLSRNVGK